MKKLMVSLVLVISVSAIAYFYINNIVKTRTAKKYEYTLRVQDNCCKPTEVDQNKLKSCPYLDSLKNKGAACKH